MEDRYLFKAKRTDNGEWVQGVLFEIEGKQVILIKDNENLLRVHYLEENMWTAEIYAIEVDSSTICQCTGLKDKNGKLIWENDVVRVTINSGSTICRCAFADTVAQFQLWQKHTIKRTSTVLNLGNYECEVIGNVLDDDLSEWEKII